MEIGLTDEFLNPVVSVVFSCYNQLRENLTLHTSHLYDLASITWDIFYPIIRLLLDFGGRLSTRASSAWENYVLRPRVLIGKITESTGMKPINTQLI